MSTPTVQFRCTGCRRLFKSSAARAERKICRECEEPLDLPAPPSVVPDALRSDDTGEAQHERESPEVPPTEERELQSLQSVATVSMVIGFLLLSLSVGSLWMGFLSFAPRGGGFVAAAAWGSAFISFALSGFAALITSKVIELLIRMARQIGSLQIARR